MCWPKNVYAVLKKKLYSSKVYYLVIQLCEKISNNKNGRFRYEMVGETQREVELLEVVAVVYPFSLKTVSSIPSATRISFFNIAGFYV